MKIVRVAVALMLMSWGGLAFAHPHLVRADPADGSTLRVAPAEFVLTFAEPARLTALSLQKDTEPAQKVGSLPEKASAKISVPAPQMVAGKYTLTWRVVGRDGHVMPGKLTFTVGATGASTSVPRATAP